MGRRSKEDGECLGQGYVARLQGRRKRGDGGGAVCYKEGLGTKENPWSFTGSSFTKDEMGESPGPGSGRAG